jgi:hypothetical protein
MTTTPTAPHRRSPRIPVALAALTVAACATAGPDAPVTSVAQVRTWPSEAELTRLQPRERYFNMGYAGQDLPLLLEPTAVKVYCEPVRRKPLRLRCRYSLTVTDWIGENPPMRPVEDLVERDPEGRWRIARCPSPGSIPDPKHNPGC